MSGTAKILPIMQPDAKKVMLTPDLARGLLERNNDNRPISYPHVERIARQITEGKWRFNGDTIKVAINENVLDGQHRCWAVIEANIAVPTLIVYGIESDAFPTVDTIRKPRSGADVLALCGLKRHGKVTATALTWLLRYQKKALPIYRDPKYRIENADVQAAFATHPHMVDAVERATPIRRLVNPAILGCFYYILYSANAELAERMMATLESPARESIHDPFYRLREWLLAPTDRRRDPIATFGLMIKMANAAAAGSEVRATLRWLPLEKQKGGFPILAVAKGKSK